MKYFLDKLRIHKRLKSCVADLEVERAVFLHKIRKMQAQLEYVKISRAILEIELKELKGNKQ